MKTVIKKSLQGLLLVPALALGLSMAAPFLGSVAVDDAQAQVSGGVGGGASAARGEDQPSGLFDGDGIFKRAVNTLLYIIGAIAVIMLIFGGFKYVTSAGDSAAVTSAKNTILYAVIGIIVAILAFAIVNFVVGEFSDPNV